MSASQLGLAEGVECSVWILTPTCQPGAATSARLLGAEEAGLLNAHVKGMLLCLVMIQAFAQVLQEFAV